MKYDPELKEPMTDAEYIGALAKMISELDLMVFREQRLRDNQVAKREEERLWQIRKYGKNIIPFPSEKERKKLKNKSP